MHVRMKRSRRTHTIAAAFVGKPPVLSEQTAKPFLRSYVAADPQPDCPTSIGC